MKRLFLTIVFATISCIRISLAQTNPIDIEMVKKDLLAEDLRETPDEQIKKMKQAQFNIMYVGNLCFVHLPYKRYGGEAFMTQADFLVYRLVDKKWTFETYTHGWYNMSLLEPGQPVFLADVEYCDMTGKCQSYKSISQYDGKGLFVFREYQGFNNKVYYDQLKGTGKPEDFKKAAGDTLYSNYTLTNIHVESNQTSFTLNRKAEVIVSIYQPLLNRKLLSINFNV